MSAADPRPVLDLPEDARETAFRAIERILREDPTLDGVVKTWRSREGHDDDMQPPAFDMMPMIALSPVPRPSTILAIDDTKVTLAVSVQIFVPRTCSRDILGLWGAVERAIVHEKPFRPGTAGQETVERYLCNLFGDGRGVIALRAVEPGFYPVDLARKDNSPSSQQGLGMLTCFFRRPA